MNNKNIKNAVLVFTMDCILFHPLDTMKTRLQTNKFNYNRIYAGIVPSMINIIPKITFRLTLFDELNTRITNPFMCGAFTGLIEGVFITGPISFYKNNYQVQNRSLVHNNLFRSIPLITLKLVTNNSLFFGLYKTYCNGDSYHDLLLSTSASFFSIVLTYPIVTVRVNIETSKERASVSNTINMVKGGFYKGFNLKLMRGILGKAFVITSYEYLKKI